MHRHRHRHGRRLRCQQRLAGRALPLRREMSLRLRSGLRLGRRRRLRLGFGLRFWRRLAKSV